MIQTARKIMALVFMSLLLSHCGKRQTVDVKQQIRQPAEQNNSLIEVTPMIPAAVQSLLTEADQQLAEGLTTTAITTLRRALSISPGSALVQQHLAEVYLADGNYQQAIYWATLVVEQGPDQGALCERSRRTQALAAELLNQAALQAQALEAIAACTTHEPARY